MVKGGGLKLFSQSVRPSVNVDIIVHVSTQAPPMDSRVKKSFYQYCRSTQRRTGRWIITNAKEPGRAEWERDCI